MSALTQTGRLMTCDLPNLHHRPAHREAQSRLWLCQVRPFVPLCSPVICCSQQGRLCPLSLSSLLYSQRNFPLLTEQIFTQTELYTSCSGGMWCNQKSLLCFSPFLPVFGCRWVEKSSSIKMNTAVESDWSLTGWASRGWLWALELSLTLSWSENPEGSVPACPVWRPHSFSPLLVVCFWGNHGNTVPASQVRKKDEWDQTLLRSRKMEEWCLHLPFKPFLHQLLLNGRSQTNRWVLMENGAQENEKPLVYIKF